MAEYGQALAPARRIEVQVVAHFALWRPAPPELRHAHGAQAVGVSVLKQLGGAAVSGTGRRHALRRFGEDGTEVFTLSEGVEHGVLREKPALQRVGHLPAARLQHGYFVFKSLHGLFLCGQKLRSTLLYAPQFGLHVLAFARHRCSFFRRNGQRRQPSCVAPGFRLAHGLPVVVLRSGVRFGTFAYLAQCVPVAFRARNAVNPPVYGRYLGLM